MDLGTNLTIYSTLPVTKERLQELKPKDCLSFAGVHVVAVHDQ